MFLSREISSVREKPFHLKILKLMFRLCLILSFWEGLTNHTFLNLNQLRKGVKIKIVSFQFSSVQSLSCVWLFATPWTSACQTCQHQLPKSTQIHVHWVGDAIQPSHPLLSPFSSCPQAFPASGSFPMSQLFASDGQSIGVSASTSVLHLYYW